MASLYQFLCVIFAVALLAGGSPVAHAQTSDAATQPTAQSFTEKLYVHVHGGVQNQDVGSDAVDTGGGFGVKLGYGFTKMYTLYLGLDVAGMSTENARMERLFGTSYTLIYLDLGSQLNFRTGEKAIPYLDVAVTFAGSGDSQGGNDLLLSGGGLSVGGGVKYFLLPSLALDGLVQFTSGGYSEFDVNGDTADTDVSYFGSRIEAGLSWYPFR